jgi:hypothetical protein
VNRDEVLKKLSRIYVLERPERIEGIVFKIPEKVFGPLQDIRKADVGPQMSDGTAPGEYKKDTKTVILYENTFNPNVLFHEIGHCIYNEFLEIAEIKKCEYKKDPLREIETTGEGLSGESGATEFCANAYGLYKAGNTLTGGTPERYRNLVENLKEKGF